MYQCFYRGKAGTEPVRDWLNSQEVKTKVNVSTALKKVVDSRIFGACSYAKMGGGLLSVNVKTDGKFAFVMFCFHEEKMILLHAFLSECSEPSNFDIKISRLRMNDAKSWS